MEIMKSDNYINEKLNIQPITKDRLSSAPPKVDEKTALFIKREGLVWNPNTRCYDSDHHVKVTESDTIDHKLPIRFGVVKGEFTCKCCGLVSLEGAPIEVGMTFNCSSNALTSLKGAPLKVGGGFNFDNNYVSKIEYVPNKIGGGFFCGCNGLKSLKGAPTEIGEYGTFSCGYNKLKSLKGAPKIVGGIFHCSENLLETLEGAPQRVGGNFFCDSNKLENLKGAPEYVGGEFSCKNNHLISLEGAPKTVVKAFDCRQNEYLVLPKDKPNCGGFRCDDALAYINENKTPMKILNTEEFIAEKLDIKPISKKRLANIKNDIENPKLTIVSVNYKKRMDSNGNVYIQTIKLKLSESELNRVNKKLKEIAYSKEKSEKLGISSDKQMYLQAKLPLKYGENYLNLTTLSTLCKVYGLKNNKRVSDNKNTCLVIDK